MVYVRALSPEEAPAACRVVSEVYWHSSASWFGERALEERKRAVEDDCALEDMTREAASTEAILLGAFLNGDLIGSGAAHLTDEEVMMIRRVFVKKQGQGAGGALLRELLEWGQLQSANKARLETVKANKKARAAAEHYHFQKAGKRKSLVAPRVTVVIYEREL